MRRAGLWQGSAHHRLVSSNSGFSRGEMAPVSEANGRNGARLTARCLIGTYREPTWSSPPRGASAPDLPTRQIMSIRPAALLSTCYGLFFGIEMQEFQRLVPDLFAVSRAHAPEAPNLPRQSLGERRPPARPPYATCAGITRFRPDISGRAVAVAKSPVACEAGCRRIVAGDPAARFDRTAARVHYRASAMRGSPTESQP